MKLVLLRHAMTDWNLEKRIQGRIDQPLGASGREQLARLELPPALRACRWYCSPLLRARQTAEVLGLTDFEIEPALIEMSWGEWEGEILKPLRRKLGETMRANESRGLDFCPPGGESPAQVQARLQPWLQCIATTAVDSAAVTHKGIIRCIYSLSSGWDMRGECPVDFSWAAAHQFELTADGRLRDSYEEIPLAG
ncbi:MAG: histidine phosphatase family protein [Gammaproteobacteria bacterium]|nr:MAG: histidine phosphatase family protein [Gammaproteobacteria bacterium]UCH41702.1 MAG: histidine phosphatase family protein [Gammaproteobacteria bacterium]